MELELRALAEGFEPENLQLFEFQQLVLLRRVR